MIKFSKYLTLGVGILSLFTVALLSNKVFIITYMCMGVILIGLSIEDKIIRRIIAKTFGILGLFACSIYFITGHKNLF
jgi:hypothetical protein